MTADASGGDMQIFQHHFLQQSSRGRVNQPLAIDDQLVLSYEKRSLSQQSSP